MAAKEIQEVGQDIQDKKIKRLIEAFYHPEDLINQLSAPPGTPRPQPAKEKLYFIVSRGSEIGNVKVVELPSQMVQLLNPGNAVSDR